MIANTAGVWLTRGLWRVLVVARIVVFCSSVDKLLACSVCVSVAHLSEVTYRALAVVPLCRQLVYILYSVMCCLRSYYVECGLVLFRRTILHIV